MGVSLTTLQSFYDKQQLQIKIMKYAIMGLTAVIVAETTYIVIDYYFGGEK